MSYTMAFILNALMPMEITTTNHNAFEGKLLYYVGYPYEYYPYVLGPEEKSIQYSSAAKSIDF